MTMLSQSKVKEVLKVETVYKAFFKGGDVDWSTDGSKLFCQCGACIKVLEVETGHVSIVIGQQEEDVDIEEDNILTFVLSSDNAMVLTAHKSGLLKQWTAGDGTLAKQWRSVHRGPVSRLALSRDGSLLATGGADSSVRLWDLVHHACTHNLQGMHGVVSVLQIRERQNGSQLIYAAGDDNIIRAWDTGSGVLVFSLVGHFSTITALAFLPGDKQLVSCGRDKVAIVWDVARAQPVRTLPLFESLETLALLPTQISLPQCCQPSGLFMAMAGERGLVHVWDVKVGRELYVQTRVGYMEEGAHGQEGGCVTRLLYNETTSLLAIVTADHNISLLALDTFQTRKQFVGFSDEILAVVYVGPKESCMAVATNSPHIKLYSVANMSCQLLAGHTDLVVGLAGTPANPCLFASASKDNSVRVWLVDETERASCICVGVRHTASVGAVSLSQVGCSFLVSVGQDTTLKLWSLPATLVAGAVVKLDVRFTGIAHDKDINSVCISPNDRLIATASFDKTCKLWSCEDLSLVGVLRGHRRGVWSAGFSPVDQVVITCSADTTVKLWSLADLSCIKTLEGHDASVMCAVFVTRGLQVLSCGGDGLIKLWSIKTSDCVGTFDSHDGKIWALAVRGDESRVVSGGSDSRLVVWRDVTEEARMEAANTRQQKVVQEQQLANLIEAHQLLPALRLALSLDRPFTALRVINDVLKISNTSLAETIKGLREDQKEALLKCVAVWNTNSRNSYSAQMVLSALLDDMSTGQLKVSQTMLEGILPYTERHFKRLTQLLQDLYLLKYTTTIMQPQAQ